MKTMKKTTKKTVKPEIILNCIDNTTPKEIYNEYVHAKVRAGRPITTEELKLAENTAVENDPAIVIFTECNCTVEPEKKPNIFKRIWNKLKYAFNW